MRDRHERIGGGPLGLDAVRELLAHPATAAVPFVLETPGSNEPGDPQVATLQSLRA